MKIIDALKMEGKPFDIPDADREDLPEFFKQMGYKVGVEIGVDRGYYSMVLAKAGLKVYGVDPWRYYSDYPHPGKQKRLDEIYEGAKRRLSKYPDYTIIRKTSMEAVSDFKNDSIDFVYIDGHHGFKYVAEDIWDWSQKVRPGGVISGHDYARGTHEDLRDPFVLHVKYVVDAYAYVMKIPNWYLVGRNERRPDEKRDRFRSWFWIKP
jgi:SAM-dependent methyltransferase